MTAEEKKLYLYNNHFTEWWKMRKQVENELSDEQNMFCCCGRLATGLHESHCRRFQSKVDSATIRRLAHLIPK